MEILPIMALALLVGANAETKETRREIREFIESVNPKFAYADEAANQLIFAQGGAGGATGRAAFWKSGRLLDAERPRYPPTGRGARVRGVHNLLGLTGIPR